MPESSSGITDLLGAPASFRTEVIIHELLRLKAPNHGRLFRALLKVHWAEAGSIEYSIRVGGKWEGTR